ncbi:MAG: NUDIX domain-containing protein [Cyanobacteria bacterium HKST-UBA02]|nr:NUDIX domain-containing protein [Cyanobacteria bacterium HKST-UBA02]
MKTELIENSPAYLEAVSGILQRYLNTFPAETEALTALASQLREEGPSICQRRNFRGHLTASALFVDTIASTALLVHHRSLDIWIQPGGHLDPDELPERGAFREFTEETGISGVRAADWHRDHEIPLDIDTHFIPANAKRDEESHYHHDFLYVLVADQPEKADINIKKDELINYKFVQLAELIKSPEPKLARVASKLGEYGKLSGRTI